MPELGKPIFRNAPGNKVRSRRGGEFICYWVARHDLVRRGFAPPAVPLWRGQEPTEFDRKYVTEQCRDLQDAMLLWNMERKLALPEVRESVFDGTVLGLINCYAHDSDSPFRKLRWGSRNSYYQFLKVIERDHGGKRIADLKARDMLRWHEAWSERGVSMAHALVLHFRGLLTFGKTILDDAECTRLSSILGDMKFKMGKPRTVVLSAEQATAICNRARAIGWHSIALAQAIQFEGMLRQRDIIGEWVPLREPGVSDVIEGDRKWLRGIRWEEFDQHFTLKHITSKRQKEVVIPLGEAPLFKQQMEWRTQIPTGGPVIVSEETGLPYSEEHFRRRWRQLANECGIPRNVQNRDSRAGAITEATESGADLESIKHAATHADIQTTQIYSRRAVEKTASVLRMRAKHRGENET